MEILIIACRLPSFLTVLVAGEQPLARVGSYAPLPTAAAYQFQDAVATISPPMVAITRSLLISMI